MRPGLLPQGTSLPVRNRKVADLVAIRLPFVSCGGIPDAYLRVMSELGPCEIKGPEEPDKYPAELIILPSPLSAMTDYYRDQECLKHGAKADILLVATDSMGHGYGFDTGDQLRFLRWTITASSKTCRCPSTFGCSAFLRAGRTARCLGLKPAGLQATA